MLSTLVLCLFLPLAEPEKPAEKTQPAPVVKTESTPSAEPAVQKTSEPQKASEDKPASTTEKTEKAAEKNASATPETPSDPKADGELLPIEVNVISYTNTERAKYGLPPLEVDKQLMSSAREHCSWMTWYRIFQHTRRPVAENIAMGQPSSLDVVRSWMNSSGHRANILNPNHRRIGVGAYRTENGTIYWVQQFSQ